MTKLFAITGKPISGEWGTDAEEGNGIPVLRTTNFTNTGKIDYSNVVMRNINKNDLTNKYLKKGDIILEKSGGSDKQPVGRVVYFDGPDDTYLFNNFTGLLRVKEQKEWLPKYVFWALYASYKQGKTRQFENKTTGLHNLQSDAFVKKTDIKQVDFCKQIEISAILDKLRCQIETRKNEINELDVLVKARFVEMFGDTKLNMKKFPQEKLSKRAKVGSSRRVFARDFQDSGIPFFRGTEVGALAEGKKIIPKLFISKKLYKELVLATGKPKIGDLLMPSICPDGRIWQVNTDEEFYFKDARVLWISPNSSDKVNSTYLRYALKQVLINNYRSVASGSTFAEMKIVSLKGLMIILPPIELQNQFASFVQQVDKSKVA